jgi:hypothetical protein
MEIDGQHFVIYQCDHCTRPLSFDGALFEAALTFAIDEAGNVFDQSNLEQINLN